MRLSQRLRESVQKPFSLQKVFVINLDRRPDRWSAITDVCSHAGIASNLIERVSAVEGSAIDVDAAHRCGFVSPLGLRRMREPPQHHIWGMDLNPNALGCALSHIQLWSRIAAAPRFCTTAAVTGEEKECFLILEDDAALTKSSASSASEFLNFAQELQHRMRHVPADWELVYVGGLDTAGQCAALAVGEGVSRVPQYHRTTSAYLVTASGARRLLATCVPLTFQLDTAMTMKVGVADGGGAGGAVAASAAAAGRSVPYVLDPVSYTLQPPLMTQAAQLGTDIQESVQKGSSC